MHDQEGLTKLAWEKAVVRSTAVRDLIGGLAPQAKLVSPLLDSVVAHCFRVALPSDHDRKLRRSVLGSQLGRLVSWKQILLDRRAEVVGWSVDIRSLDELALLWG